MVYIFLQKQVPVDSYSELLEHLFKGNTFFRYEPGLSRIKI